MKAIMQNKMRDPYKHSHSGKKEYNCSNTVVIHCTAALLQPPLVFTIDSCNSCQS